MQLQLTQVVASWIESVGVEKAIEVLSDKIGKTYKPNTVSGWKNRLQAPPIAVAQMVLDDNPIRIQDPNTLFPDAKIYIGSCVYRDVSPWTYKATHVLRHRYGERLGLLVEAGTDLPLKRNRLVERFLKTDADWLLWLDDDMAPPIGYPSESAKWGAKFDPSWNGVDVLERLMSHEKTFVSALCFDRGGAGVPMFAEGRNDPTIAENIRSTTPRDELRATDWVGSGCALVHRKVFEDIHQKIPDIRTPDHIPDGYYTALGHGYGEDTSFAIRAKESGHQPYVDLGCVCGHAGTVVHYNQKIR